MAAARMTKSKAAAGGMPAPVAAVFRGYAPATRNRFMKVRDIILKTAARMDGVNIEETLRWGQPAYVAKGASTIRIDAVKNEPGRIAMYFICHTDLIAGFREHYPTLEYGGNRAILFDAKAKLPEDALRHCISMALRYHTGK
jgi:hypothetical protein